MTHIGHKHESRSNGTGVPFYVACCALAVLLLAGCNATPKLDTKFGQRGTVAGAESIAGTAALSNIFSAAGYKIYTRSKLSPFLNNHRVVVWAPDDFSPPDLEAVQYLEKWLAERQDRVLIFIGRDYDAATDYWTRVLPQAAPAEAPEAVRQLALARSRHAYERSQVADGKQCSWFKLDTTQPRRVVTELDGDWSEALGQDPVRLELGHRLVATKTQDSFSALYSGEVEWTPLLSSGDDTLVAQATRPNWFQSRVYVVANGSFLLNLPLLDAGNRRLAGQLVTACGKPDSVVFLDTEPGSKLIDAEGSEKANPYAWLTVFPVGVILMHIFFLGILISAVAFPIFGRPRTLPADNRADFGEHVRALGELLARADNAEFARRQIEQYRQIAGRETTRGAVGISSGGKKKS